MKTIKKIKNRVKKLLAPPPEMHIWQWCEKHFVVPQDAAEPGKYKVTRTPYLKGVFESVKNPNVEEIVCMFAAQTGKTALQQGISGYAVTEEQGSGILFLMPTKELAQDFSQEKYAKFIKSSKILKNLLTGKKSEVGDKILGKFFKNGSWIAFAGANSENSVSSRSVRWVLMDEISRMPDSVGSEGSPIKLARKRTSTFFNKKIIMTSTPTVKGGCKSTKIYEDDATKRFEFRVICPECHERIHLKWTQVMWNNRNPVDSAYYECQECGEDIKLDSRKHKILNSGDWFDLDPEKGDFRHGYKLSALYSPWVSLSEMVREFKSAVDAGELEMKTFVNTYLGEPFTAENKAVEHAQLFMRREHYPEYIEVPGGSILTCGVDVGHDRLVAEVVAWGSNLESWSVEYRTLWGDPSDIKTWAQLKHLLDAEYTSIYGFKIPILATCIDTGGHHTRETYQFIKNYTARYRIWGIKGKEGERPIVSSPSKKKTGRDARPIDLYIVGVDTAKHLIYDYLSVNKEGPRYCHFPVRDEYDPNHFKQLTAEYPEVVYVRGRQVVRWKKPSHIRVEPLDCRVYALAALEILNPRWDRVDVEIQDRAAAIKNGTLQGWEWVRDKKTDKIKEIEEKKKHEKTNKNKKRLRKSFLNSWRYL